VIHPLRETRFLISASDARQLGGCHAEVALVGRSNVGKSSLLNALTGQAGLARVSGTPGRTRLINVFATRTDRWIVDLPGYGYAAGPKAESHGWREMIETYLLGRPTLRAVFVLVDAETGATRLDLQMVAWLRHVRIPWRIVATKADRVKASRRTAQGREVALALRVDPADVAWVSNKKGTGLPGLRTEVAELLDLR
jgi:GTP-binding protein